LRFSKKKVQTESNLNLVQFKINPLKGMYFVNNYLLLMEIFAILSNAGLIITGWFGNMA